MKMTLVNRH